MQHAGDYRLTEQAIGLPKGAFAHSHRRMLYRGDRPLLGLTQGRFRPYVFPLFTPAGFAVTSESPADHPHHNSLWIAADHVHAHMPVDGGTEDYTYNFYVDDVFQGRAPGRIVETGCTLAPAGDDAVTLTQSIDWRGPREWGAPDGRLVLQEQRRLTVRAGALATEITLASRIAAPAFAVSIGPTRHAWFNLRLAETLLPGLVLADDRGPAENRLPALAGARWVHASGPVGGGHRAGVLFQPRLADGAPSWFVTDWGVITTGAFRTTAAHLPQGGAIETECRIVVHDGSVLPA